MDTSYKNGNVELPFCVITCIGSRTTGLVSRNISSFVFHERVTMTTKPFVFYYTNVVFPRLSSFTPSVTGLIIRKNIYMKGAYFQHV